tara:strand:+ start:802 stop:2361 length:1560 start_codon:yes stop_codon:yes gene_type:complete
MPAGGTDPTTQMKILLAPVWDHNFPGGPGRWLAGQSGAGLSAAGDQDNYYPKSPNTTAATKEYSEPWWPADNVDDGDPSARFCWDADNRGVDPEAFVAGTEGRTRKQGIGIGSNWLSGADEEETTRNRLRGTGSPKHSWNTSDTTYVDTSTFLEAASGHNAFRPYPNHFQDYVHDAILQGSDPSDTTANKKRMFPNKPGTANDYSDAQGEAQRTQGSQYSKFYNKGIATHAGTEDGPKFQWRSGAGSGVNDSETYTYGYEFTLNVESVTHTWSTISSISPLPGVGPMDIEKGLDSAQLLNMSIDVGAMQEQISVKGKLFDGPEQPYAATGERHIRKQQLLDIIRGQHAAQNSSNITGHGAGKTMMQPNRFVALTLGPMHSLNENGDMGKTITRTPGTNTNKIPKTLGTGIYQNPGDRTTYKLKALDMWRYGEEPSDDIRGESLYVSDADSKFVSEVSTYKFNYKGRRRYRGIITRVNVSLSGGSPDVWDFSFEFAVVKNETQYRRHAGQFATDPNSQPE